MPTCKWCNGFDHYSTFCFQRPKTKVKQRRPIKQVGKKASKWLLFRKRYLANHPPNHQGYYKCYLCLKQIPAAEITLDHVIARSKRPDLVFDESNIRLSCYPCNSAKGSKNL